MTSTPVSLNDESLNGSWIDINSASQINSPVDDGNLRQPVLSTESMQSLGIISFQVERFLQEVQRNQSNANMTASQRNLPSDNLSSVDDVPEACLSDTDVEILDGKRFVESLKKYHHKKPGLDETVNNNDHLQSKSSYNNTYQGSTSGFQILSKAGDCLVDQLSDSLSLLSRASGFGDATHDAKGEFQQFDWLWDWTSQPEYFAGQEWKLRSAKQEHLMKQRQMYESNLSGNNGKDYFSSDVMSLLFLTNILSIILASGLTYSILTKKFSV